MSSARDEPIEEVFELVHAVEQVIGEGGEGLGWTATRADGDRQTAAGGACHLEIGRTVADQCDRSGIDADGSTEGPNHARRGLQPVAGVAAGEEGEVRRDPELLRAPPGRGLAVHCREPERETARCEPAQEAGHVAQGPGRMAFFVVELGHGQGHRIDPVAAQGRELGLGRPKRRDRRVGRPQQGTVGGEPAGDGVPAKSAQQLLREAVVATGRSRERAGGRPVARNPGGAQIDERAVLVEQHRPDRAREPIGHDFDPVCFRTGAFRQADPPIILLPPSAALMHKRGGSGRDHDLVIERGEAIMGKARFAVAIVFGALVIAGGAVAQDPIKARQAEFKEFGKRMGAIKDTVIDRKGGTMADVAANAEYLAAKIPQIPSWFPEGSDKGETRALPDIWLNFADFEAKAKAAEGLARALVVAAKGGDQTATAQAFGKLGQEGCGGCHQPYRRPQN